MIGRPVVIETQDLGAFTNQSCRVRHVQQRSYHVALEAGGQLLPLAHCYSYQPVEVYPGLPWPRQKGGMRWRDRSIAS